MGRKVRQGNGEGGKGRLRAGARIFLITAGRMPAHPRGALPARDVIAVSLGNLLAFEFIGPTGFCWSSAQSWWG